MKGAGNHQLAKCLPKRKAREERKAADDQLSDCSLSKVNKIR